MEDYLETFNANTNNGVGKASSNINVNFAPLQPGPDTTPNVRPGSVPDVGSNTASDTRLDFTPDPRPDSMLGVRLDSALNAQLDSTFNMQPDTVSNARLDFMPDTGPDAGPDTVSDAIPDPLPDASSGPALSMKKKHHQADLTLLTKILKTCKKGDNFHQFRSHLITCVPVNKTYTFVEDSKKCIKIYLRITNDITNLVCLVSLKPSDWASLCFQVR